MNSINHFHTEQTQIMGAKPAFLKKADSSLIKAGNAINFQNLMNGNVALTHQASKAVSEKIIPSPLPAAPNKEVFYKADIRPTGIVCHIPEQLVTLNPDGGRPNCLPPEDPSWAEIHNPVDESADIDEHPIVCWMPPIKGAVKWLGNRGPVMEQPVPSPNKKMMIAETNHVLFNQDELVSAEKFIKPEIKPMPMEVPSKDKV